MLLCSTKSNLHESYNIVLNFIKILFLYVYFVARVFCPPCIFPFGQGLHNPSAVVVFCGSDTVAFAMRPKADVPVEKSDGRLWHAVSWPYGGGGGRELVGLCLRNSLIHFNVPYFVW